MSLIDNPVVGDSIALSFSTTPKQDLTDWTCRVQVREVDSLSAALDFDITDLSSDNTEFIGGFRTNLLTAGKYYIVAKLDNVTTNQHKEIQLTMTLGVSLFV